MDGIKVAVVLFMAVVSGLVVWLKKKDQRENIREVPVRPPGPARSARSARSDRTEGSVQDEVENSMICSITNFPMKEPVMARCGHTFEEQAIIEWIRKGNTCPTCRRPIRVQDLTKNFVLKEVIRSYQQNKQRRQQRRQERRRRMSEAQNLN